MNFKIIVIYFFFKSDDHSEKNVQTLKNIYIVCTRKLNAG